MELEERFEAVEYRVDGFDSIPNKRSNREDLHALMLLDELFPGDMDMIAWAEYERIWLSIEWRDLETLTDAQIKELVQCGVQYDGDKQSLYMFT